MNLLLYCTLQRVSTVHLSDDDWSVQPKKVAVFILDFHLVFGRTINTLLRNTHRHGVTQTVFLADSSTWSLVRKYRGFHRVLTHLEAEAANRFPIYLYLQSGNSTLYLVSDVAYYVWLEFIMLLIRPWKCEYIMSETSATPTPKCSKNIDFFRVDRLGGSGPLTDLLHLWHISNFSVQLRLMIFLMEASLCAYKRNITLKIARQHNYFITQGTYTGYMFRL